ncbi:hypothetical protein SDC9_206657 [bioreactor metagenome]|uniref:Uncharacterized protein n=1 Tax=bioreactor metagenome TaxID=1076179 RepID=A0A645J5P5_9ZZZZ
MCNKPCKLFVVIHLVEQTGEYDDGTVGQGISVDNAGFHHFKIQVNLIV